MLVVYYVDIQLISCMLIFSTMNTIQLTASISISLPKVQQNIAYRKVILEL